MSDGFTWTSYAFFGQNTLNCSPFWSRTRLGFFLIRLCLIGILPLLFLIVTHAGVAVELLFRFRLDNMQHKPFKSYNCDVAVEVSCKSVIPYKPQLHILDPSDAFMGKHSCCATVYEYDHNALRTI